MIINLDQPVRKKFQIAEYFLNGLQLLLAATSRETAKGTTRELKYQPFQ